MQKIVSLIDECSAELRYLNELLEVREKIRKLQDLYPTQKKYAAMISFDRMTTLMAREIELNRYMEEK